MAAMKIYLKSQTARNVIEQQPQMLQSEIHHPLHDEAALPTSFSSEQLRAAG